MRGIVLVVTALLLACEQNAARGAACRRDAECQSPLVCALGRCRAECRESRDCEVGTRCLVEPATGLGVCSVPIVDSCVTTECPAGFVCDDGECLNACAAVTRCADGVCVDGACIVVIGDAGVLDDASVPVDAAVDAGQPCHGPGCDPVIDVAIAGPRTFVVTRSGGVWAWGSSAAAELGDGLVAHGDCADCSATPVRALLPGGAPFTSAVEIAAGEGFACARLAEGTVWCWGYDGEGQLGDDGGASSPTPVQVLAQSGSTLAPVTDAVAIAAGRSHTCIVRGPSRETWCWGQGTDGELGTGALVDEGVAVRATAFPAPTEQLALSYRHTLARGADGTVLGVGHDDCAVLGAAMPDEIVTTPVAPAFGPARSITTTTWNACALSASGTVGCWGLAGAALGPTTSTFAPCAGCGSGGDACTTEPQPIPTAAGVTFERILAGGDGLYFGITASGDAWVWGGAFGAAIEHQTTPLLVPLRGSTSVVDASGGGHACFVTNEGDVLCFGENADGQLGRGTHDEPDYRLAPVVWP